MDTFHLPGWEVLRVEESEYVYRVTVKLLSLSRFCPSCGALSNRYGSRLQIYTDKPMDGKRVSLGKLTERWTDVTLKGGNLH